MADDAKMPFLAHLAELRQRLIWGVVAVGVGIVASMAFSRHLLAFVMRPLSVDLILQRRPPFLLQRPKATPPEVIFTAPAEAFWAHLKVALLAGVVLALPVVLVQVWRFVEPGLLPKEKKFALPFVLLSTISFAVGLAFCYVVVLPGALNFLLSFDPNLKPMLKVGEYIDFSVKFLLAFGLIFELPLGITIAARLGMVTPRFLARNRKYAILLCFIAAAILTPTPDIFNQLLMAVPMYLLYEVGIIAARIMARRREAAKDKSEQD
jgi:sec-independent protein translocase protein TatC